MGAVAAMVAALATGTGVTICTGARVATIRVENDRAAGVTLDTGEEIAAGLVVSAISPQATLRHLAGPAHLDTGTLRQVHGIKSRGGAAKLHLALSGHRISAARTCATALSSRPRSTRWNAPSTR
jgi:phytoene dehydrogenase-like protein